MKIPKKHSDFCTKLAKSIMKEVDVEKLDTIRKEKKFCSDMSKALTRIMNALYGELGKFVVDVYLTVLCKKKYVRVELNLR